MALLHRADLRPSKLELLAAWLPGRPWYQGQGDADLRHVAACRFDDPAGEVGVETILVQAGAGPVHQVPLTYRDAPLDGGDQWLVGTMDHSVLGHRWVYDACGDPVYVAALAEAIFAGTGQAEEFFEVDGQRQRRESTMTITSGVDQGTPFSGVGQGRRVVDGDPTHIVTDAVELAVLRCLDGRTRATGVTLTSTWSGQPTPALLAYATLR